MTTSTQTHQPVAADAVGAPGDQRLDAQWAYLHLLEQLDPAAAARALSRSLAAEATAAKRMVPLRYWPLLPRLNYETYLTAAGRARLRRLLGYVQPGDRLLDVGTGYGYVAGVLLRDAALEYYCGIDIADHLLAGVRQMAEINELSQHPFELFKQSLFRLDRAFVQARRPSLILVLEVLEHLPNPEEALCALTAAMPETAEVLFSVPLGGRLEDCWEHLAIFGADRLQRMCRKAGLFVQHVEPVFNNWTFVLASRSTSPSVRALRLPALALLGDAQEAKWDEPLKPVDLATLPVEPSNRWNVRAGSQVLRETAAGFHCEITGAAVPDSQYAGVQIPLAAPCVLRLDLTLHRPQNIQAVYVDGLDERGERVLRWQWQLPSGCSPPAQRATYILKAGRPGGPFQPMGPTDPAKVASLHVFLRIIPAASCGFTLHRLHAACIGQS